MLQRDGNLVVYSRTREVLYATGTTRRTGGNPGAWTALQGDGNLVLRTHSGAPLFATATRADGRCRLVVQNDGNLVLYSGDGAALWSSAVAQQQR